MEKLQASSAKMEEAEKEFKAGLSTGLFEKSFSDAIASLEFGYESQ